MPTRVLREGILDSEAVCSLTFPAEVFYRRLMSVVDDFGRFDGRVSVLRSRLYPLQIDKVREADIPRWIAECEKAGLIALYSVSGKPYILFHKLGSPRAKESKFPSPPAGYDSQPAPDPGEYASVYRRAQPYTDENNGMQTRADVPGSGSSSSSSSGTSSEVSSEPASPRSKPPPAKGPVDEVMIEFPTVGAVPTWSLTRTQVAKWAAQYPGLDVPAECRKALAWVEANPTKRKTARGMPAFLVNWLNRATNGPAATPARPPAGKPPPAGDSALDRMYRLANEMGLKIGSNPDPEPVEATP